MRMAQPRAGSAFAEEPVTRTRSTVFAADDLDRDLVAEERPASPVDRTHSTLGQQGQNLVAIVEDLPRREHGTIRPLIRDSKPRVRGLGIRNSGLGIRESPLIKF